MNAQAETRKLNKLINKEKSNPIPETLTLNNSRLIFIIPLTLMFFQVHFTQSH